MINVQIVNNLNINNIYYKKEKKNKSKVKEKKIK